MQLICFEETLVALVVEVKGEPWYIDSGTNKHVKPSIEFQNIESACGNSHPSQGKGDVIFHYLIREIKMIEDVFYVPGQRNFIYLCRKSN
jgi:hypothetical protein